MMTGFLALASAMTSASTCSRLSQDTRQAMEQDGWQRRLATQLGSDSAVLAFEKDGRSALFAFDRNRAAQPSDDTGVTVSVQLQGGAAPP